MIRASPLTGAVQGRISFRLLKEVRNMVLPLAMALPMLPVRAISRRNRRREEVVVNKRIDKEKGHPGEQGWPFY
jgi:hypothetical protein